MASVTQTVRVEPFSHANPATVKASNQPRNGGDVASRVGATYERPGGRKKCYTESTDQNCLGKDVLCVVVVVSLCC